MHDRERPDSSNGKSTAPSRTFRQLQLNGAIVPSHSRPPEFDATAQWHDGHVAIGRLAGDLEPLLDHGSLHPSAPLQFRQHPGLPLVPWRLLHIYGRRFARLRNAPLRTVPHKDPTPQKIPLAAVVSHGVGGDVDPDITLEALGDIAALHVDMERKRREQSSFLRYENDGQFANFHALCRTFITNLSLARHSDINLTMNTYTVLQVLDQAAAVEALSPVPEVKGRVVPKEGRNQRKDSGSAAAENGTIERLASDDVTRILSAWAQISADVRERFLTSSRVP